MTTAADLRQIFNGARPLIEQWLDLADEFAAFRDAAREKGLDWSQIKGLLKAQAQDERDGTGEGKRVKKIIERADFASAYADMLGLGAKMNEKSFSGAETTTVPAAPVSTATVRVTTEQLSEMRAAGLLHDTSKSPPEQTESIPNFLWRGPERGAA